MNENKNLIIALSLSVLLIIGWQEFYQKPRVVAYNNYLKSQKEAELKQSKIAKDIEISQKEEHIYELKEGVIPAEKIIAKQVKIESQKLHGVFDSTGSSFTSLFLTKYKEEKESENNIELLFPKSANFPYFIGSGYLSDKVKDLPNMNSIWQTDNEVLSPETPITLTFTSESGVHFIRKVSLDKDYMFTVEDRVINNSNYDVDVKPFSFINRGYNVEKTHYAVVHEGPLLFHDGKIVERKFSDLEEDGSEKFQSTGGWFGFSDKYWLSAIIPASGDSYEADFKFYQKDGKKRYQASYLGISNLLSSGSEVTYTTRFFIGAKELNLLEKYEKQYGLGLFDRSVDFGIWYFLTKPIFKLLHFIFEGVGNFGFAIIILTIIIRILLYPLAKKSFTSMAKMKKLQPEMNKLKERYKDNRAQFQQSLMALYKKENVSPLSGCLPILLQIPIFFSLYKVLLISIEMRHAEFVGWIHDLSAPDPTSIANLFGLLPFDVSIQFGIWPCILGFTMVLQQSFNPPAADPMQAKVIKAMPYLFVFLFASFPAGLVIYWSCNNLLSILQQWLIKRKLDRQDGK